MKSKRARVFFCLIVLLVAFSVRGAAAYELIPMTAGQEKSIEVGVDDIFNLINLKTFEGIAVLMSGSPEEIAVAIAPSDNQTDGINYAFMGFVNGAGIPEIYFEMLTTPDTYSRSSSVNAPTGLGLFGIMVLSVPEGFDSWPVKFMLDLSLTEGEAAKEK